MGLALALASSRNRSIVDFAMSFSMSPMRYTSRRRPDCSFSSNSLTASTRSPRRRSSISLMAHPAISCCVPSLPVARLQTSWARMLGPPREGDDELLRGEHVGKADDLHVDEPRRLPGVHHLALAQILRALRAQRP